MEIRDRTLACCEGLLNVLKRITPLTMYVRLMNGVNGGLSRTRL